MKKTLLPNDLRDFLSIISFMGFLAIFFKYTFQSFTLSNMMDAIFLIFSGVGLMVVGKVFTMGKWARDGIQRNEVASLFAVLFGLSSMIIGILLMFGLNLLLTVQGFIGFLALAPAIFIFFDYLSKNRR